MTTATKEATAAEVPMVPVPTLAELQEQRRTVVTQLAALKQEQEDIEEMLDRTTDPHEILRLRKRRSPELPDEIWALQMTLHELDKGIGELLLPDLNAEVQTTGEAHMKEQEKLREQAEITNEAQATADDARIKRKDCQMQIRQAELARADLMREGPQYASSIRRPKPQQQQWG